MGYYVKPVGEDLYYGPYSLRSAQDFGRIGSQTGRDRLVLRGIEKPVRVRRYSKGKRVWPKTKAQARGLRAAEVPRKLEEGSMARSRKKTAAQRKAAKKMSSAPRWKSGTKHPVTGEAVGGRLMSGRDRRLFTTTGKTRKGVGPATIKKAYGPKAARNVAGRRGGSRRGGKAPSKKKASAKKRKVGPKKTAAAKKARPKRPARAAPGPRSPVRRPPPAQPRKNPSQVTRKGADLDVIGYLPQHGKYVVADGSGRILAGARTLASARKKLKAIMASKPAIATHIVRMR